MKIKSDSTRPARALIFDFDGLIVDTEGPLYDSWQALYQEHGHHLPLETYVECVGSTTKRFHPADHLLSLLSDEAVQRTALEDRHATHVRRTLQTQDTLPGVRERLIEAREAGLKLAVASSSDSHWIDNWLDKLQLTPFFSVVRTRDHVSEAKPSPELFLAAADMLEVRPEESIVFEDSHNGLTAAIAAKMRCVAVPNRITAHCAFDQASLVLKNLAELRLDQILRRIGA